MRLIPGNTKVQIEIFKGFTLWDMLVGAIELTILALLVISNIPFKWIVVAIHVIISVVLLTKIDNESNYLYYIHLLSHLGYKKKYDKYYTGEKLLEIAKEGEQKVTLEDIFPEEKEKKSNKRDANCADTDVEDLAAFTDIKDGFISFKGGYLGVAFEIPDIEFRFFSQFRRDNSIENGLGSVLRSLRNDFCSNLLKIERPVDYRQYELDTYKRIDDIKRSYEKGFFDDEEVKSRLAILYSRLEQIQTLRTENRVVVPYYYLIVFESDKNRLNVRTQQILSTLAVGEINAKQLNDKELALMLKYTNSLDFDEREIDKIRPEDYAKWAMPDSVSFTPRTAVIDGLTTYTMRVVKYPSIVGDAWLASLASFPSTKVMIKFKTMDSASAVKSIDRSLSELRSLIATAKTDSQAIEAQNHFDTLQSMLVTLKNNNEILLCTNMYVTCYDLALSREKNNELQSFRYNLSGMKKVVRRNWVESGFGLNSLDLQQAEGYIASQVSGYDPFEKKGRGIPSNTLAAAYPWVFPHIKDNQGFYVGSSDGVPIFMNFFERSSDRVNSNMVVIGKTGSGKSYAVKTLLSNFSAENAKIFIIDPENEYTKLAKNLNGKFINVASNDNGIINPFHIIADLEDEVGGGAKTSYSSHLQFLEEFFRMILPDCDKDSLEYLNSLTERVYRRKGIGPETDVSKYPPEAFPTFDDLYDEILVEFQRTNIDYVKTMLRTLMNYVSKFATGGRNSQIWNGPSSISTDDNFIVFDFQGLLANQNSLVANAQMMLVLKYISNEIIKNRATNEKLGLDKKVVLVIDEAHVFIDSKYPAALDFMFQMAKRIRKYNGMQIVITQNVKDFVGSDEITRKSSAIINACQYSLIFSLSPNDMEDLCQLYDKAGKINEYEQEQIVQAPRGNAFVIVSPTARTSFSFKVPEETKKMFSEDYRNPYFEGVGGDANWISEMGDSIEKHKNVKMEEPEYEYDGIVSGNKTRFTELPEEELAQAELTKQVLETVKNAADNSQQLYSAEVPAFDASSRHTELLLGGVIEKLGEISGVLSSIGEVGLQSYASASRINNLAAQVQMLSEKINSSNSNAGAAEKPASSSSSAGISLGNVFESSFEDDDDDDYSDSYFDLFGANDSGSDEDDEDFEDILPSTKDEAAAPDFDLFAMLTEASAKASSNALESFAASTDDTKIIKVSLAELISYNRKKAVGE